MEKYVKLGFLGEGSYGLVSKCRNVETGQTVAIKKFPDSDRDKAVKKIAMREIKMLKQLNHDNLVNLLEVFNHKKKIYLVFEFLEKSVADELENHLTGMIEPEVRGIMWQVLRGLKFCHDKNVLHRDIKPENILMSKSGIVKLCDFGFARTLNHPDTILTDYVATRWYRAPELLVGEVRYGRSVDIWSVGCVAGELLSGEPVFAGNSDLDQLFVIVKCLGNLTPHLEEIYTRNDIFRGTKLPHVSKWQTLQERYKHNLTEEAIDFLDNLLISSFFTKTGFHLTFPKELQAIMEKENGSRIKRSDKKHHRKMAMKSYIEEKYSNESVVNMNKYPLDNHRESLTMNESVTSDDTSPSTELKDCAAADKCKRPRKETMKMQSQMFPNESMVFKAKDDGLLNAACSKNNLVLPQVFGNKGAKMNESFSNNIYTKTSVNQTYKKELNLPHLRMHF